jgi:hypothetical protein
VACVKETGQLWGPVDAAWAEPAEPPKHNSANASLTALDQERPN